MGRNRKENIPWGSKRKSGGIAKMVLDICGIDVGQLGFFLRPTAYRVSHGQNVRWKGFHRLYLHRH